MQASLPTVLVVGAGSIGERHVRCFQATGRAEVSVCETDPDRLRQVATTYGIAAAYADLQTALATAHDAAVIATPANTHIPIALRLAEAGSHLLIEKPLSTRLEGIDRLGELISRHGLTAAVAYVYRAHPVLRAMKEAIDAGRFGAPVELVVTAGQHFPTYRPAYRNIYYNDRAAGGGAIQDALTHLVNAAQWLVGPVDSLVADAAHQVLEGVQVEDTVHVLTRHGGVLGSFSLNQYQAPNEMTLSVVCRSGTAQFMYHRNAWRWMTEPGGTWHDEAGGSLERDTLFIHQAASFLDAIQTSAPPLCTLAEGLQTLHTNLAILASTTNRTWQTLPPPPSRAPAGSRRSE